MDTYQDYAAADWDFDEFIDFGAWFTSPTLTSSYEPLLRDSVPPLLASNSIVGPESVASPGDANHLTWTRPLLPKDPSEATSRGTSHGMPCPTYSSLARDPDPTKTIRSISTIRHQSIVRQEVSDRRDQDTRDRRATQRRCYTG